MKYFIDVEKIEGTNLWKAKGFNTLVFDKNGLMKLIALEDELNDYYRSLKDENEKLKHCNKSIKGMLKNEGELLSKAVKEKKKLKKENEELKKYNEYLSKEVREFDKICTKLKNEKEELRNILPKEENVSIEEVVDTDTVVRLMSNQFEHSERQYERLLHTIKSQKGMLKKQGKDISRLQKDNKDLKEQLLDVTEKCADASFENSRYKKINKNLSIENEKLKNIICFGKDN